MPPSLGCDVVSIRRFGDLVREGGMIFLERIFHPHEYQGATIEHLAGLFAAKEAACKALALPAGNWLSLHLTHDENGAPCLQVVRDKPGKCELRVSISHDGDYAMAVVLADLS